MALQCLRSVLWIKTSRRTWIESSLRTRKRIFSYLPQRHRNKAWDPSYPCQLCQVTEIMVAAVPLRSPWLCSQRRITRGCPFRSGVPGRTTTSLLLWPLDIGGSQHDKRWKSCFTQQGKQSVRAQGLCVLWNLTLSAGKMILKSSVMGFTHKITKWGLCFRQCNINDPSKRMNYLYSLQGTFFGEYVEDWQTCCRSFRMMNCTSHVKRNVIEMMAFMCTLHKCCVYVRKTALFSINASIAARP